MKTILCETTYYNIPLWVRKCTTKAIQTVHNERGDHMVAILLPHGSLRGRCLRDQFIRGRLLRRAASQEGEHESLRCNGDDLLASGLCCRHFHLFRDLLGGCRFCWLCLLGSLLRSRSWLCSNSFRMPCWICQGCWLCLLGSFLRSS